MTTEASWEAQMQAEDLLDRLYSVKVIAARANVSEDTIRRAIKVGELPACKVRGRVRIWGRDFEAWAARARVRPAVAGSSRVSFAPVMDGRW